ncbi:MAG: insulinase family protein [Prevotella sp.]|nr:insulinase family protein [Prevotella sp.]
MKSAIYNTATLSNGLRVIHLPSTAQVIYCGFAVGVGSRHEQTGQEGLAHFCEHVSFKGTQTRSAMQILNHLERVGGDLNAFTNKEDTVFYAAVLKQHLPKAVDLLSDLVFRSIYPQQEIDREVEVICDEIESYNDSPAELIFDEIENFCFEGHPLGHNILGSAERVRAFTTADALAFTRQFYQPANAIFFASGDLSFEKLLRLLEKLTPASSTFVAPSADTTVPSSHHEAHTPKTDAPIIVDKGTHQAHVMLGTEAFPFDHPLRLPLYLLNNLLGGPGMNARLNVALRERNGLVYTVESSLVAYSDTGLWCTYFGCDPHDVERCLHMVRRELQKLVRQPLSDRQLAAAKRQIKGQIGVASDNRENFALDMARIFLHQQKQKDVDALYQAIDALTPEQLQQAAAEIFEPHRLSTLIFE